MMFIIKNVGYKLLLILFCVIAIVYYEITVPLINGIIQLKINFLGFFLETFLQWAFDISIRQAQIISALIYLFVAIFLLGFFLIRIFENLFTSIYAVRRSWLALTQWQKAGVIVFITILLLAIGKIVLLLI